MFFGNTNHRNIMVTPHQRLICLQNLNFVRCMMCSYTLMSYFL